MQAAPAIELLNNYAPSIIDQSIIDTFVETCEGDPAMSWVMTREANPACGVFLTDGTNVPCEAVAEDILGNVAVVTMTGTTKQYLKYEVQ